MRPTRHTRLSRELASTIATLGGVQQKLGRADTLKQEMAAKKKKDDDMEVDAPWKDSEGNGKGDKDVGWYTSAGHGQGKGYAWKGKAPRGKGKAL